MCERTETPCSLEQGANDAKVSMTRRRSGVFIRVRVTMLNFFVRAKFRCKYVPSRPMMVFLRAN